ncbi:PAS domain-containing protein [Saccharophagus degradans]|uniref:methyl-accepting chemotaxis protein n=1 Tax=Saccharophagus degradans TaxID=86304 RepID=UPI001C096AF9|nr:methyl-accepting chemotaxis protein [Saccharophagus degradans]MBU2985446.1 PAS domain-containing protein [Saccharophagus degradans]
MKKLFDLFGGFNKQYTQELEDKVNAARSALAVIEFTPDGIVETANDLFLAGMGYSLNEIQGKHHSIFVTEAYKNSSEYKNFWSNLRRGEALSGEIERVTRSGGSILLHATYSPLKNEDGEVYRVIKFATDITQVRRESNQANALKLCQANVMLADNDLNIIYMNDTVTEMLQVREKELQEHLPTFKVKDLIGTNVDTFHKSPAHQRKLLGELKTPYKTTLNIGDLVFGLIATPWLDSQGVRLGTVVEWLDKTEEVKKQNELAAIAAENARVRYALDSVTANVMIADPEGTILYMNESVNGMFKNAESDIKRDLPNFDSRTLLGTNMDVFHKNPAHQRNLLTNLTGTYNGGAKVGGRTFTVIANPIFVDGKKIGAVVEWADRTAEVAIEREIDEMVSAASQGDFTKQISLDGKQGFFLGLAKGLNDLVSTVEVALNDISRVLGSMARGVLTERITRNYEGSFGELKENANGTIEKLTDIIGKIRTASNAISTAANEIAQGNADLSQRTEEQASSLEETASSMEEMTSTVRQSAENAQQANTLAMSAQKKAGEGGQVVSKAVEAMGAISESSKKINDIIGVIDEIAFQTNLLALNAAVEAARAGEQGRGFAVVAGEVRNLAQRSAAAAKEIKELIRDSVSKVEDGTVLVNRSGETLEELVSSVETVSNMMREISNGATEQTSGIEQVNTAISQMDEMTQQNAALVEEASAAGEAMAEQAARLMEEVSFFTISQNEQRMVASARPVAKSAPHRPASAPSVSDDDWEDF